MGDNYSRLTPFQRRILITELWVSALLISGVAFLLLRFLLRGVLLLLSWSTDSNTLIQMQYCPLIMRPSSARADVQ
jgi:hypothetical protein